MPRLTLTLVFIRSELFVQVAPVGWELLEGMLSVISESDRGNQQTTAQLDRGRADFQFASECVGWARLGIWCNGNI